MKRSHPVQVYVDPDFRRWLRIESSKRDKSVIDFSRDLALTKGLLGENEEAQNYDQKRKIFRIL